MEKSILTGLANRGFDVESARSAGYLRAKDGTQLEFAAKSERTLITYDSDFLTESAVFLAAGKHHSGILLTNAHHDVGTIIRAVQRTLDELRPEDLRDQIRWLRIPNR